MPLVDIGGFEALLHQHLLEPVKRVRTIRPLIESIGGAHQMADQPDESFRGLSRAVVRLGRHCSKNFCHPAAPVGTAVRPVRAGPAKNSAMYMLER